MSPTAIFNFQGKCDGLRRVWVACSWVRCGVFFSAQARRGGWINVAVVVRGISGAARGRLEQRSRAQMMTVLS